MQREEQYFYSGTQKNNFINQIQIQLSIPFHPTTTQTTTTTT
jgi:hypothetical protein